MTKTEREELEALAAFWAEPKATKTPAPAKRRIRTEITVLSVAQGCQEAPGGQESSLYTVKASTGETYRYETFSTRWKVGQSYKISATVQGEWLSSPRPVKAV